MDREFAEARYSTKLSRDDAEGWIALILLCQVAHKSETVARVVFWDAAGQYFLETAGGELPLVIVEALIAEAKASIQVG